MPMLRDVFSGTVLPIARNAPLPVAIPNVSGAPAQTPAQRQAVATGVPVHGAITALMGVGTPQPYTFSDGTSGYVLTRYEGWVVAIYQDNAQMYVAPDGSGLMFTPDGSVYPFDAPSPNTGPAYRGTYVQPTTVYVPPPITTPFRRLF